MGKHEVSMFSLVVLFSNDRKKQFDLCVDCWKDMPMFDQADRILLVDGVCDFDYPEWKIVNYSRSDDYYCWADAINLGIESCNTDILFYLDCDRIPDVDFFLNGLNVLRNNNAFIYTEHLYNLKVNGISKKYIRKLQSTSDSFLLTPDHRSLNPVDIGKKNPFSGCVGFSKDLYYNTPGFDSRYKGWGCPDTDMFMSCVEAGCDFISIQGNELHLAHDYNVDNYTHVLHNIWNINQLVSKWKLNRIILVIKVNNMLKTKTRVNKCLNIINQSESLDHFIKYMLHE